MLDRGPTVWPYHMLWSGPSPVDVRFGSEADICTATSHVRFTPKKADMCISKAESLHFCYCRSFLGVAAVVRHRWCRRLPSDIPRRVQSLSRLADWIRPTPRISFGPYHFFSGLMR